MLEPVVQADELRWSRARVNALWRLGTVLRLQGDAQGAVSRLEQALAHTSKRPRSELDRGEILVEIGQARADLRTKRSRDRIQHFGTRAAAANTSTRDAGSGGCACRTRTRRSRPGPRCHGLGIFERADAFWREFDAENRWAGEAALWLGRCYLALGRRADADAALERAESILTRSPLPADTRLVRLARSR